jgi:beta-1,4-mannooligosaccharide/beta-1,4-mannosyl-N-acetylglucosamine phosphorylase
VALLDLEHPAHVLARGAQNVLEPREPYELMGQVPGVVFPSGLVVDRTDEAGFAPEDATAYLYYGAADTCVGLATASIGQLLADCRVESASSTTPRTS